MPNRIFRDGFVDSEAVNALSDWTHRVYANLLVKCDDAGRFDGRAEMLRSHLFPLGLARRLDDFHKAIEELRATRLAVLYEFGGKPYLQVTKWQRCGKSLTSRFPWQDGSYEIRYVTRQTRDGPKEFVATSLLDNYGVHTGSPPGSNGVTPKTNTETETETETKEPPSPPPGGRAGPSAESSPGFSRFWSSWPKHFRKADKSACLRKWERGGLEEISTDVLAGLERWKASRQWQKQDGEFIPAPLPWLNKRQWESSEIPAADHAGEGVGNGEFKPQFTAEMAEAAGVPFLPEGGEK